MVASFRSLRSRCLLALTLLAASCAGDSAPRPNVILVSIDTLRADHLSCYGYQRNTSPNLDRFAERSLRYTNAIAPSPWTLPSHAAMLTGRDPVEIGVTELRSRVPKKVGTLAEALSDAGYQTAAFVDSMRKGFVGGERGFKRGFDRYEHAPHVSEWTYRYDMAATVDAATAWMDDRDADRPFFLFLHTKTVHSISGLGARSQPERHRDLDGDVDAPYHTPAPYRLRFVENEAMRFRWVDKETGKAGVNYLLELNERVREGQLDPTSFPRKKLAELIALYDGGIAYTDEHLGRLFDALEALELAANTIVVITSDHGEEFLEHGQFFHEQLYGESLRIPLVLHDPREGKGAGQSVDAFVTLADIPPTILARVGLNVPATMSGRPLPSDAAPTTEAAPLFAAHVRERDGETWRNGAIHQDGYKLVYQRLGGEAATAELFDLLGDPLDVTPLQDADDHKARMLAHLEAWLAGEADGEADLELDDETMEGLRALGYGE